LAVWGLLTALPPYRLTAQTSPAIRSAVQLAAEGRSDSAQRLVNAELARGRPGDAAWVEALYFRARLATFGDSAERDLRRVAIEYSSSVWADDALLQLSQLALAAGNPASALDLAGRVRSDYPDSDLKSRAALWAARAAFEVGEPRTACALLDTAQTEAAADVEFVNQVGFYRARCTATVLAPPPPRAPRDTISTPPVPAADTGLRSPVSGPRFEVQAAAPSSDAAARDVVRRLAGAGHTARVVPVDNGVYRVRMGPYPTQAAADSAVRAARALLGGSPFIVRLP
jgi:cell division septation protein DedD